MWAALSKNNKSCQNSAWTLNIFTDPEFVFFAESYSDFQIVGKLEGTSCIKLSTTHFFEWNFSSICFEFFPSGQVQLSPGSEVDYRTNTKFFHPINVFVCATKTIFLLFHCKILVSRAGMGDKTHKVNSKLTLCAINTTLYQSEEFFYCLIYLFSPSYDLLTGLWVPAKRRQANNYMDWSMRLREMWISCLCLDQFYIIIPNMLV